MCVVSLYVIVVEFIKEDYKDTMLAFLFLMFFLFYAEVVGSLRAKQNFKSSKLLKQKRHYTVCKEYIEFKDSISKK